MEISLLRADVDRLDSAGQQIVSAIDGVVTRIDREVSSLKNTMRLVQQELSGRQDDLSSVEAELKEVKQIAQKTAATLPEVRRDFESRTSQIHGEVSALKAELQQVKRDVAALRASRGGGGALIKEQSRELAAMRGDLAQLRKRMDQDRSKTSSEAPSSFPSQELNILTSNIVKIGNRASKVETLQMEFDIMKERVERLERARPDQQTAASPPPRRRSEDQGEGQPRRKRHSSPETSSSKRPMLSSDVPDVPDPPDLPDCVEGPDSSPPDSGLGPATRGRLSRTENHSGEFPRRGRRRIGG